MDLTDRDKRTLRFGGIALGVLLVGYVLFGVLGGGDEAPVPTGPTGPLPSGESPEPTDSPSATVSPTTIFAGRDPFAIPAIFVSPTTGSASPTSPGTSPTSPGTSPSTSSTSPGGGGGPSDDDTATLGGRTVVLIDVFMRNGQERADIEVNAVVYNNLREGEEFGPGLNYELRSISGNCVVVLFGDESATLCTDPQK
jgi:hypothetical protein